MDFLVTIYSLLPDSESPYASEEAVWSAEDYSIKSESALGEDKQCKCSISDATLSEGVH